MTEEKAISFHNEDINFELGSTELISKWIEQVILNKKCRLVQLNFIYCSDSFLHEVNIQYLNHNTYTDVITFPYASPPEIEGDIFISIDRITENAKTYEVPFEEELFRVMIHGALHLCGFHDKTPEDKTRMTQEENAALQMLSTIRNEK